MLANWIDTSNNIGHEKEISIERNYNPKQHYHYP